MKYKCLNHYSVYGYKLFQLYIQFHLGRSFVIANIRNDRFIR